MTALRETTMLVHAREPRGADDLPVARVSLAMYDAMIDAGQRVACLAFPDDLIDWS